MLTVKARITSSSQPSAIVPLLIPDLNEVRSFAQHLHATQKAWQGEIFGWPAEYAPESRRKPIGSKMKFTPADFWIGESGIWFFSMMWERGKDKLATEFLDDRGLVKPAKQARASRKNLSG